MLPIRLICAVTRHFRWIRNRKIFSAFFSIECISKHISGSLQNRIQNLLLCSVECVEVKWEAAHRCCSTVAEGWCCHTGSHTKLPFPTSFPLFLSLLQLFLLSVGSFVLLSPLSVSSSRRHPFLSPPTFTDRRTHTHLHLPQLPFYSPAPASPPASSWSLRDTLPSRSLLSK